MSQRIVQWISAFPLVAELREHVTAVLIALPDSVLEDLISDPAFRIGDFDPGEPMLHVPSDLLASRTPPRFVMLKRTLLLRPHGFVRYVIAHELAHAHLRNAGRHADEDPEHAADALAAEWGFPRTSWR